MITKSVQNWALGLLCLTVLLIGTPAQAQRPVAEGQSAQSQNGISVSIGPGITIGPDYPGARELELRPIPAIDIRYDRFFFDRNGLGVNLIDDRESGWQAGASVFVRFGRDESDDPIILRGLGDINVAPQGRLFVSKSFGPVALGATLAHDFGGSNGSTLDVTASYRTRVGERAFIVFGPRVSIADENFNEAFFGISETQAVSGNRAPYDIGGGIYQVGFSTVLSYSIDRNWSATVFGSFDYLVDDAAESPIISRRGQPSAGVAISYRF